MNAPNAKQHAHAVVGRNKARFDEPPEYVPAGQDRDTGHWKVWEGAGTKIDAPLLGNGDMLAAFAGAPSEPQFWVTTNDFWRLESWVSAAENLLVVEFTSSEETEVEVRFHFPNEPGWGVDQYVDFTGHEPTDESLAGTFVGLIGSPPIRQKSSRDGVLTGLRSYEEKVDRISRVSFAGRFVDSEDTVVTVRHGKSES